MPVPSNTTAATAIILSPGTTTQQVDDGATTYDVYYKYTNSGAEDIVISVGVWGDLGGSGYRPGVSVYKDQALSIFVHAGFTNGSFTLPLPAGWTYWFKVDHVAGDTVPSNLNFKFIVGPESPLLAGLIFIRSASIATWMIDAGLTGLVGGLIDADAENIVGLIPQFIAGEMGDILPTSGRMLFTDEFGSLNGFPAEGYYVYLVDSDFSEIANFAFPTSGTGVIRTHNPTEKFYVCTSASSGSGFKYRTVDAEGTLGTLTTLTSPGGTISAIGVNDDESVMYVARLGAGNPIKRWDLVNAAYLSDFTAGISSHRPTDILVLEDDTVLVCWFKTTVTRDCFVRHYDSDGTLLATFTFTYASTLTTVNPRLGYSSETGTFWLLNHLTTGFADVRKVRVSDGVELATSLTPDVKQDSIQQADPDLPHTSDSCPIIELRISDSEGDGIIGPIAWVHTYRVQP